MKKRNYWVAQMDEMQSVPCSCGMTRRAFVREDNPVATIHMVDVQREAKPHYHRKMTEIYLVLEGEGHVECDGELLPVKPLTAIYISPGVRHRAIGSFRFVNIPIPAFDPSDEYFD